MSSELLETIDHDPNGYTVQLTMSASGYAELTTINRGDDDPGPCGYDTKPTASYQLSPDEKGWKNAQQIANALQEWINHTKRIAGIVAEARKIVNTTDEQEQEDIAHFRRNLINPTVFTKSDETRGQAANTLIVDDAANKIGHYIEDLITKLTDQEQSCQN